MEYLLFPEELRGDFGTAAAAAAHLLDEARRTADAATLADRLMGLGAIRIQQGRVLEAHGLLREAKAAVPQDTARQLRALSGELLATYEQFNTFPDGNGAGATEIENHWRGAADLQPLDAEWHRLLAATSDQTARIDAWLAYAFLCNLRPSRYVLESARYVPASVPTPELLQTMLQTPDAMRHMSEAGGFVQGAAYADVVAADLCRRAGDREQAFTRLARARAAYASADDGVGEAACLLLEGDWRAAPFSTPLAWNLAIQDSNSEGSNLSVPVEADEFRTPDQAQVEQARRLYEDAAVRFRIATAPRGLSACALRQGYLLAALGGQFSVAREALDEATAGFARCGHERGQQLALTHLVMAAIGEGTTATADLLDRARAIGDWGRRSGSFSFALGLGILLNRWSRHWLIRRGNYERAVSASQTAGALYEGLGAAVNAAQTVVDCGSIYQALGERPLALTCYEEALDRYTAALSSHPRIAENLRQRILMLGSNVFHLYLQQMDADGMERSAGRLAAMVASLPDATDRASLLGSLLKSAGTETSGPSGPGPSLPSGVETWALRQLATSNIELASVLVPVYRARRIRDEGDGEAADQLLDEAERALGHVSAGQRNFLEVIVLGERRQYPGAAEAYRRHLEAGGANAGFVGKLTSFMEAVGGAHATAELRLQQRRTHEQAFAAFVRVKAYAEALGHLQALEQIAGKEWWRGDARPWQALSDAAEVYEGLAQSADATGYYARALDSYDTAIEQLEARRSLLSRDELRTALSADKGAQYLYFLAARAAMRCQDRARAFHYAERGRARALLDLMAAGSLVRESGHASGPLKEWRETNARLGLRRGLLALERARAQPDQARADELARQIAGDEAQLGDVEARLLEAAPALAESLRATAPVLTVDQVASGLPADTLLVELMFLGEDLLAWAVDREGLAGAFAVSLDTRELAANVRRFHAICRERGPTRELAAALGDRLLGPFEPLLRRTSSLIVVPYGAAHLLPFQALTVGGRLLADTHRLAYLPSASALQYLDRSSTAGRAGPRRLLAVGNPRAMSFRPPFAERSLPLAPLPAAATEAAYVASLFAPDATLLVGPDATEAAVREHLAEHSLLHLATHGNLVEEAPLASSLSLANGDELTVYELMGERVDADLVVLSACETARGATTGGDDVLGLTRALLAAGARSAVVSLWPVDDVSTSLFMGHFYRRLREGADPAEALASAQRDLRAMKPAEIADALAAVEECLRRSGADDAAVTPIATATRARGPAAPADASPPVYSHPYYWAPFILIG